MTADDEFTNRLIGFGLSEKEAQTYLHLLKYGPKTPSPLAKSLHTYLEDMHRTLTSLIEKGMVLPSLNSPTAFAAVDIEIALEAAFKKQESELREMEVRKQELQELALQQRFQPTDKVTTFKIIKNVKELVAALLPVVTSMKEDWVMVVPESAVVIASQFGINQAAYDFIARGGRVRVLLYDLSYPIIEIVQEMIDNGEEVRYLDKRGIKFTIFDRTACISAINVNMARVSLNQQMTALWTDDPIYAQYLMLTFEMLWKQSVPAEDRLQELLEQGPPQADN
jgi:sugar-specific transcriptional regulator TrmB